MTDLSNLYVNLDVVLTKRTTLGSLLAPHEIEMLRSRAIKNHWDDDTKIANIHRYLKDNILDLLDSSDFLDSNIIIESDPYTIKAMQLMEMSQRDAEVLLVDKEYRYPGCWVNDIAKALKNLDIPSENKRETAIWDAYYGHNWEENYKIPGWTKLADVLEDYYNTL